VIDVESAKRNPASCFERPSDVLEHEDLSREQKVEILRQWDYDTLQLAVATDESMTSEAAANGQRVAEIHKALEELGETDHPLSGGTKFG